MSSPHGYEHESPEDVLEHPAEEAKITSIDPVPVAVQGPVQTQSVGAVGWASTNFSVGATLPVQIATPQPQRSLLVIETATANVFLGRSSAEAAAKTGFLIGTADPGQIAMHHREEVWAIADSGTAVVSVYQEYWVS